MRIGPIRLPSIREEKGHCLHLNQKLYGIRVNALHPTFDDSLPWYER